LYEFCAHYLDAVSRGAHTWCAFVTPFLYAFCTAHHFCDFIAACKKDLQIIKAQYL
jgi:hypothetical protein